MSRDLPTITGLINQIYQWLNEEKTEQFFGGDALKVNEFTAQLSNDTSSTYSLTLTPKSELGVLPSSLSLKWVNPNRQSQSVDNFFSYQVYRSDGVFEWLIDGGHINDFDTYVSLQYIGDGEVNLTRVS